METYRPKTDESFFIFFDEIYERKVTVYFYAFLRDDRKFDSKDELVRAIEQDKMNAIKYFDNGGIS